MMPTEAEDGKVNISNVKTIGRNAACDLVITQATASRVHARIELKNNGSLWVVDADSRNGTFLNRNAALIRIKQVSLCQEDRILFGDYEVSLPQLTALFDKRAGIKLGDKQYSLRQGGKDRESSGMWGKPGHSMQKPKRNPVTGRVEEDRQ